MPKIITTTVYEYNELPTDKAKHRARQWYLEGAAISNNTFNDMVQDAKRIGLKITRLVYGDCEGEFTGSAFDTMNKIREEHGQDCETFKIAKRYEDAIDALPEQVTNLEEENRNAESLDALETEFLADLLEQYRLMHVQNVEYYESDEQVAEQIQENEYTFTGEGKRFG